jgi:FeS assembly SUF system protein
MDPFNSMNYHDYDQMFGHLDGPELDEDGKARFGEPLPEGTKPASEEAVIEAMRQVYDPEIPVNVFELGLIYDYRIDEAGDVFVKMTLTAPGCPVAGILPGHLAKTVGEVEGVGRVEVELTWDPPWTPALMSEEARVELNMF